MVAAVFGIRMALVTSIVADVVANFLVGVGTAVGIGDTGLLGAVYLATFLIFNVSRTMPRRHCCFLLP